MRKRLQVLLDDEEMREIRRAAGRHCLTVAEWVRRVLRTARRSEPGAAAGKKLDMVRAATRHSFPAGDIERILSTGHEGLPAIGRLPGPGRDRAVPSPTDSRAARDAPAAPTASARAGRSPPTRRTPPG